MGEDFVERLNGMFAFALWDVRREELPLVRVLDTNELTDPRLRSAVLRAWDLPQFPGDMNTSLYMLFRPIRSHSTVALSGESADEVFGGYAWFHARKAVQARTFDGREKSLLRASDHSYLCEHSARRGRAPVNSA